MLIMMILGVGTDFWNTAKRIFKTGPTPHGLVGKKNAANLKMQEELHMYMDEILQFAEPIATSYVHEQTDHHTNISAKRPDPDILYLPPYWSKRAIFACFAHEKDWKVRANKVATMTKEIRADDLWVQQNKQPEPVCG
jgi:hypothetical protein